MLILMMICIRTWSEWQQEIWECQTNTKEFEWCWWWRWFCKISARFNNNYTTHLKSDNDDRDEEHQMELGNNTMSSNNNKYSDDDWDHKRKYEKTYISTVEYLIAIQIYICLAFLLLIVTMVTNRLGFRTQIHKFWNKKYDKTNASTYRKMQIQIRIIIIIHKLSKSWIVWSSIGGIWGRLG